MPGWEGGQGQGNRINSMSPMSRLLGLTRFAPPILRPLVSFAENYLLLMHTGEAMGCGSGAGKRVKTRTPPPLLFFPIFFPNNSRNALMMNDLQLRPINQLVTPNLRFGALSSQ